jgi:SAM-dependent methyltransferase
MGRMHDYGPSTYGDRWADVYDEWVPLAELDTEATVDFLAELAGDGPALELAVGTGRIALPLAERNVQVEGIDASARMVERLRAKPGGEHLRVTIGDMADVGVSGRYRLVYVVFNTVFGLLTQDDQARCFENVAARLDGGGVFVVEAFVPDLTRFDRNQRVDVLEVESDRVRIDAARHDPVQQRISTQHVVVTEAGMRLYPVHLRYAYPSELDLMARLAGLRLKERFGGWRREPFTSESGKHVSVYERASA